MYRSCRSMWSEGREETKQTKSKRKGNGMNLVKNGGDQRDHERIFEIIDQKLGLHEGELTLQEEWNYCHHE